MIFLLINLNKGQYSELWRIVQNLSRQNKKIQKKLKLLKTKKETLYLTIKQRVQSAIC